MKVVPAISWTDPVNRSLACLGERLQRTASLNQTRRLPCHESNIDFCSNDYLGFSKQGLVSSALSQKADAIARVRSFGSTGSRLLSGNSPEAMQLEHVAATFHDAPSALLFNSGYDANLGLFSSLPAGNAEVFYDERVHASVKDGIRLSRVRALPFRHSDLTHLEKRLARATQTPFVAVEAIYSMDGDFAPLSDLVALCQRFDAHLIVDEAHSVGVFGEAGQGLVFDLNLQSQVLARVVTYGKAFGCQGACVLGPELLKTYLMNFAHSFVFSTALPKTSIDALSVAYDLMASRPERQQLFDNVHRFCASLTRRGLAAHFLPSLSPVQGLLLPPSKLAAASSTLQAHGFDVMPIRSPSVQRGTERLRLCLHSFNTDYEIEELITLLERFL